MKFAGVFFRLLSVFVLIIATAGCDELIAAGTLTALIQAQPLLSGNVPQPLASSAATPAIDNGIKVKALYLTGWTVGSSARVQRFVDLAARTEVNAYVVDIKDDDGLVGYESQLPEVRAVGGWQKKYNARKVLDAFDAAGIHVIGRVVCFKDPVLSSKRPELAVRTAKGGVWRDDKGLTWLNPYKREAWEYLVKVAKEGVALGFDEIQFDYVRFANDGDKKGMHFGDTGKRRKFDVINEFLAYARQEMPGVVLSADVFGIICESPADTEDIGQYLEHVGRDIDYISPMVYPSHYARGQIINKIKFEKPDLDPYHVVYNTLVKAKNRIDAVPGYRARVRPYLQDFTASWLGSGLYKKYGGNEVRQQIKAVYEAGYEEWILWSASNRYSESGLLPDSGQELAVEQKPKAHPPAATPELTPAAAPQAKVQPGDVG